jgi:hypothetical protein
MGNGRRQGWLVRIAPRQVPTGGQEVQLVTVKAVPPTEGDEQQEQSTGEACQWPPGDIRHLIGFPDECRHGAMLAATVAPGQRTALDWSVKTE